MRNPLRAALFLLCSCTYASAQYFSAPPVTINSFFVPNAGDLMTNYNRFVSDGNTAFNAFAATIAGIGAGITPAHAVVGFNLGACPSGWTAATGAAGTVDMRGRFPMATNGAPANGTFTASGIAVHKHIATGTFVMTMNSANRNAGGGGVVSGATGSSGASIGAVNSAGARTGAETRPSNIALLYCEKN